ncbi:hypothetical protein T265_08659 [Opisthorchis viverrini]|uniref:Protein kinase domain-containing protein n=1 Tax=Opisthorchis viverrini TaxID=6198 RepID=A0A074Z8I0_OPIVI|nr:hypothetical protein T265_08659 [Opisthorchis viverrini]KER23438.1 hypothetical protein T265_08659 [Opisthorchis viverrini]
MPFSGSLRLQAYWMNLRRYVKEKKIGSGTYGVVYKVRDKRDSLVYAIKKITLERVQSLFLVHWEYECRVHEIIHRNRQISIVYEYAEWDLKRFMEENNFKKTSEYSLSHAGLPMSLVTVGYLSLLLSQSFGRQLLNALHFCHQLKVFHRDLKPSNLLLTREGFLKLADFGLSRTYSMSNRTYCHEVVTLWYRAPELMLGAKQYDESIDTWSFGCILYEMITGEVLFPGDSEIDELFLVFRMFGTPTEQTWKGVSKMPDYKEVFPKFKATGFQKCRIPPDAKIMLQVKV